MVVLCQMPGCEDPREGRGSGKLEGKEGFRQEREAVVVQGAGAGHAVDLTGWPEGSSWKPGARGSPGRADEGDLTSS